MIYRHYYIRNHTPWVTLPSLINERQKGKQKMLWSRGGAHNILQIRASVFSKSWNDKWDKVEGELYPLAA